MCLLKKPHWTDRQIKFINQFSYHNILVANFYFKCLPCTCDHSSNVDPPGTRCCSRNKKDDEDYKAFMLKLLTISGNRFVV